MSVAPPLLAVEGLTKSYGGIHAVRGVSFSLRAGEILALIGPNGAGKSTCFDMLNGQNQPDTGHVRLLGEETTGKKTARDLAHGRRTDLPDHRDLRHHDGARERAGRADLARQAVVQSVRLGAELSIAARLGGCSNWSAWAARRDRPCGELAYGDLKRLELAVALANQPKLLLMDEPTAGMAPRERVELMRLTAQIARAKSIGVLFTEHDMDVVFEHADRIIVLNRGTLIAGGLAGRGARQSAGPGGLSRRGPRLRGRAS